MRHPLNAYANWVGELKKTNLASPEWFEFFGRIMESSTAGLPQDDNVKWTYLTVPQIVTQLSEQGIVISSYIVRQMLKTRG